MPDMSYADFLRDRERPIDPCDAFVAPPSMGIALDVEPERAEVVRKATRPFCPETMVMCRVRPGLPREMHVVMRTQIVDGIPIVKRMVFRAGRWFHVLKTDMGWLAAEMLHDIRPGADPSRNVSILEFVPDKAACLALDAAREAEAERVARDAAAAGYGPTSKLPGSVNNPADPGE